MCIIYFSDIDECILGMHNCSDDRDCVDLMGGFVCQCHNEGYELADDGVTCIGETVPLEPLSMHICY